MRVWCVCLCEGLLSIWFLHIFSGLFTLLWFSMITTLLLFFSSSSNPFSPPSPSPLRPPTILISILYYHVLFCTVSGQHFGLSDGSLWPCAGGGCRQRGTLGHCRSGSVTATVGTKPGQKHEGHRPAWSRGHLCYHRAGWQLGIVCWQVERWCCGFLRFPVSV